MIKCELKSDKMLLNWTNAQKLSVFKEEKQCLYKRYVFLIKMPLRMVVSSKFLFIFKNMVGLSLNEAKSPKKVEMS